MGGNRRESAHPPGLGLPGWGPGGWGSPGERAEQQRAWGPAMHGMPTPVRTLHLPCRHSRIIFQSPHAGAQGSQKAGRTPEPLHPRALSPPATPSGKSRGFPYSATSICKYLRRFLSRIPACDRCPAVGWHPADDAWPCIPGFAGVPCATPRHGRPVHRCGSRGGKHALLPVSKHLQRSRSFSHV